MLVLSGKQGERVVMVTGAGEVVEVVVVAVRGGKVRLGFSAPETVRVDRSEVWASRSRSSRKDQRDD